MGVNNAPTRPVGTPDYTYGLTGQTGFLTELAETVPDLQFPESVRTYARMRRDPKLAAVLSAYCLPLLRCQWAVDPAGVDNAEAVDLVAGDLGLPVLGAKGRPADSPIRGFRWHDHVRLALLSLTYGFMPFERWYTVRDGRTHLAGVAERQPHTVAFVDVGDDGQLKSIEQTTQLTPITANRLTWYVQHREGNNWAGVSLLRPCYSAWILKHDVMRVHATSHRRWGMGIPVVKAPPGATPAQIEEARRLATGYRGGDQAGAGLPDGFTFEVAGMTGAVPDAVAFLGYLDQQMSGSALTGLLELGSTNYGPRALGDTFMDLFTLSLQAVGDAIGDTATYGDPAMPGLSRSLVDYNWGEEQPCPRIVATDVGESHDATATAIQQLVACGALQADDELEAFIREAWALPARKTPRTPPPAPPQGRPPGSPQPPGDGGATPAEPSPGRQPPARQAPAPTPAPGPGPAPAAASARGDGLRRALTPVEAAAGLDPEAIRAELESARDLLLDRWAPVIAAQRRDLAAQVEAAVDEGRIDRLATIAADPGDGTGLLYRAMSTAANKAAARMIGEAAAQGVTIDPKTVSIDEGRLRKIAAARATIAAQALGAAASRRALQVVQAAAGADAAQEVTATLAGMSTASLADQLMAAMHAASNEGRFAVLDAGPEAAYTSSEVMDQNTCLSPDTEVTTARGPVRADEVRLNDHLLTHAGRWVQPSHIVVSEVEEPLVRVRLDGLSAPERVLVLTQDHPVLVAERGGLLWREAGQLTPGDLVVGEASAQPGRELRVPDLGFGQPPHRVAAGGQVRRLAAIHVRTQRMPVGPIGLDYQVAGQEIDHPRPDLRLAAEVVSGSAQRQPDGPLQAGLRAGGPVAAHGAEPLTGLGGRHDPERCAALGAGDHDRRAAACLTAVPPGLGAGMPERRAAPGTYGVSSAGIAATPAGAVGVATGVGNGHLEVPAAAGAGLGDPVLGRPHPGADLGIGEFACDGAVDGPRFAPAGNLPAAGCAVAGRILDAEGGRPGAVAAHRPLDDDSPAPASTQAIHNLSLYVVGAVSRERHAGLVYDFTIPGDATFCAGGVIVHNCKPCLSIDGYRFASLADARAAYAAGGYKDCDGGLRCRGTVVASWEEPPPPGTPEAYEEGLYGPLGQHLGPSSWRDVGLAGSAGEDGPKAAGRWSPAEHPRDGHGRFARKAGPDYLPPPRVIARTPPGQLDLWHHTTPRAARDIYRTGTWESQAQGRVYGSTVPFGVGGYGKAAVHIRVPASMARLEDTLPAGERHYSVPAADLTPEHLRDLYSGSDEEQWWAEWRRRAGYVSGASGAGPP